MPRFREEVIENQPQPLPIIAATNQRVCELSEELQQAAFQLLELHGAEGCECELCGAVAKWMDSIESASDDISQAMPCTVKDFEPVTADEPLMASVE